MVRTINKRFSNITDEEEKSWFSEKRKKEIVNTLRGKKKHDTKEEKLYDTNKIELPTNEWNKHITAFWGESIRNMKIQLLNNGIH